MVATAGKIVNFDCGYYKIICNHQGKTTKKLSTAMGGIPGDYQKKILANLPICSDDFVKGQLIFVNFSLCY